MWGDIKQQLSRRQESPVTSLTWGIGNFASVITEGLFIGGSIASMVTWGNTPERIYNYVGQYGELPYSFGDAMLPIASNSHSLIGLGAETNHLYTNYSVVNY